MCDNARVERSSELAKRSLGATVSVETVSCGRRRRQSCGSDPSCRDEELSDLHNSFQSFRSHNSDETSNTLKNHEKRLMSHNFINGNFLSPCPSKGSADGTMKGVSQSEWRDQKGHESFQLLERSHDEFTGDDSGATVETSLSSFLLSESFDKKEEDESLSVVCLANGDEATQEENTKSKVRERNLNSLSNIPSRSLPVQSLSVLDAKDCRRLSMPRNRSKRHPTPAQSQPRRSLRISERFSSSMSEIEEQQNCHSSLSSNSASERRNRPPLPTRTASKTKSLQQWQAIQARRNSHRRTSKSKSSIENSVEQASQRRRGNPAVVRWERANPAKQCFAKVLQEIEKPAPKKRKSAQRRKPKQEHTELPFVVCWQRTLPSTARSPVEEQSTPRRNAQRRRPARKAVARKTTNRSTEIVHWGRPASIQVSTRQLSRAEKVAFCPPF